MDKHIFVAISKDERAAALMLELLLLHEAVEIEMQ